MANPVKWYVNLPFDPKKHQGSKIPITAEPQDFGPGFQVVEFTLEPVGDRNTDLRCLAANQRARIIQRVATNYQGKFRSGLALPHVGGDRYKVKVSKLGDPQNGFETEVFETWRRFYVRVHHMSSEALRVFNDMRAGIERAFKKAFIEVVWLPDAPSATCVDEPWTPDDVSNLPHLYDAARTPLKKKPFHMRLVVVNDLFSKMEHRYTRFVTLERMPEDLSGYPLDTEEPLGYTPTDSGCRTALARRQASDPWIDVTDLVDKDGDKRLRVRLQGDADLFSHLALGGTVELAVTTRERNHFCGYSLNNFCAVRAREPRGVVAVLQTFTHEVGHSLSLAIDREDKYDLATGNRTGEERNSYWQGDDHGGQGPHCRYNCTEVATSETTSGHTWVWQQGSLCTMFYADNPHVDPSGSFCPQCVPRLTRVDMSARAMRGGRRTTWPPHPPPNWDTY